MAIPVIDIFAGPGGLGEGFTSLIDNQGNRIFKIVLSIEKDPYAHSTLRLRSFFRQFRHGEIPVDYYEFLKGKISLDELFLKWPREAESAKKETWHAELGEGNGGVNNKNVDKRIVESLQGRSDWLLIGGPPCQAYSVIGRARRGEAVLDESTDERVGLYKQYLRILAVHNPKAFVMENVPGLLSAHTKDSPVFTRILRDLANPVRAYLSDFKNDGRNLTCPGYKIFSLAVKPESFDLEGNPVFKQRDFIIQSEKYGVPQTRHRIILLGIRKDYDFIPEVLETVDEVPISKVILGMPKIRSGLTGNVDQEKSWKENIRKLKKSRNLSGTDKAVLKEMKKQISKLEKFPEGTGSEFIYNRNVCIGYRSDWYLDDNLNGICNHSARYHMGSDLLRYFYVSCFAKVYGQSPRLKHFPDDLLPKHRNVGEGIADYKFADRFTVQLWNKPSKTITSHISKDGHYYIHPDPGQCRSFSVREAARIQTFPDNYFFTGSRSSQYIQVGNAVPPLLANKIAKIISCIYIQHNHETENEYSRCHENVQSIKKPWL